MPSIDDKDPQFPENLKRALESSPQKMILKGLQDELDGLPEAVLISGDLSTFGSIDGYKNCLDFIKERVSPKYFDYNRCRIFLAPGNHDIDRNKFSEDSLYPKFEPFLDALNEKKFPRIPVEENISTEIEVNYGKLRIIIINSCLGCGERRYYPEEFREVMTKIVSSNKDYEDLDTPIFRIGDIESMIELIKSKDKNCLPIILTHHNLLTMKKPRIAMYTELINSGYMREKLLSLRRPILYLHGHIHDNAIEMIHSPVHKDSKLICISAPLLLPIKDDNNFDHGFNKIRIVFSQNKKPLGCEIEQYNYGNGNSKIDKSRIRFLSSPDTMAQVTASEIKIIKLIDELKMKYLYELRDSYYDKFQEKINIMDLHDLIDELEWLGLVNYNRNDDDYELGTVRSVIP